MDGEIWYLIVGAVLVLMALAGSVLKRLPLSASMIYLGLGYLLSSGVMNLLSLDIIEDASLMERLTEVAVLISLFAAGLKLHVPFRDRRWTLPIRLATVSMVVTVMLVAAFGVFAIGLGWGPAILLGAIIAPTDPVLAADVQVGNPYDRDHLRFGLTGEAGMNDGTAFPFVMLGLGLMGLHDIGTLGMRWMQIDVLWAIFSGIGTGTLSGWAIARLVLHLRRAHKEALGLDEFLALGLIALSYGIALSVHGYGFLAVFAAGVALRRVERVETGDDSAKEPEVEPTIGDEKAATHPDTAPAYMASALLTFNEQAERIAEVAIVMLIGALLPVVNATPMLGVFVVLLLVVIRPIAVLAGCAGHRITRTRLAMTAWFGVRGVGSLYYLAYAIGHGLAGENARIITDYVLATVAASVVLHGISVTPLMSWYDERRSRRGSGAG